MEGGAERRLPFLGFNAGGNSYISKIKQGEKISPC
jgi:hypothetical protein